MTRSPDRSGVRWLKAELSQLVEQGVITAEAAQALDRHYAAEIQTEPSRIGFVISAILGSALLGAGVILLVAHNWDQLSRPLRCVIAFLPLVATQGLSILVLFRRNESQAWRESVTIFNFAAIGTAISLVSQTYQIQGDFAKFILVWMLLALPVVYLFRSTFGLCAYIVGTIVWVVSKSGFFHPQSSALWFWPLLLLAVPAFAALLRRARNGLEAQVATVLFVVAAAFGLSLTNEIGARSFYGITFAGLWTITYLVGADYFSDRRVRRSYLLAAIGWSGILWLTIALSFKSSWRLSEIIMGSDLDPEKALALAVAAQIGWVAAAILLVALSFWRTKRDETNFAPAALPSVALAAWLIFKATDNQLIPSLLLNLYGLALGICTLLRGVRAGRVFEANLGMLIITVLAIARFFDSEFEFLVRGLGFIVIGAGFLITNMVVFKRRAHP
ncbi:MAG TPA: DUF2157 domain-containing protein [Chthoniobacterales bacterium]